MSFLWFFFFSENTSTSAPYSRDAAYDTLRSAKKHNYNVDHVYTDGRYIPIVHRVNAERNATLSEGDFPDGPHVKHHYYYNKYEHDHRNKSEGPVVRHHFHNKDVKVYYHDHRNKSAGGGGASTDYSKYPTSTSYNPSKYSSSTSYSPSKYAPSSTYQPDDDAGGNKYPADESAGEGYSSSSEKPIVKHHHHFKEYHYDERGRLVDPKKYNYTDSARGNYSSSDDDDPPPSGSEHAEEGESAVDETRSGYSEQDGDNGTREELADEAPTTRSYYQQGASVYAGRRPASTGVGLGPRGSRYGKSTWLVWRPRPRWSSSWSVGWPKGWPSHSERDW